MDFPPPPLILPPPSSCLFRSFYCLPPNCFPLPPSHPPTPPLPPQVYVRITHSYPLPPSSKGRIPAGVFPPPSFSTTTCVPATQPHCAFNCPPPPLHTKLTFLLFLSPLPIPPISSTAGIPLSYASKCSRRHFVQRLFSQTGGQK